MTRPDLLRLATEIRRLAIVAIHAARSGHPGGALSAADILAVLFGGELGLSLETMALPARNRFVLSKGHACPALYAAGAGIGLVSREAVYGLRKLGSVMQGHPDVKLLPWVETSTGSLGQGMSVACGIALGQRLKGMRARSYVLLGDGELQEGEIWEAAMFAAHHRLANLCAIVDYNKMQSDDLNENIMGLAPLAEKWRSFGWRVEEIDGHDLGAIAAAFAGFRAEPGRPSVIIAHTIKGKGVSFMEGVPSWHGSVTMREADTVQALADLGVAEQDIPGWIDASIHKKMIDASIHSKTTEAAR